MLTFWDTVRGVELADTLIRTLPKICETLEKICENQKEGEEKENAEHL